MSDEGMSDGDLAEMREWARDGFGFPNMTTPNEVWRSIIARLDAAERARDALQTLLNMAQPSICYLACEHGSTFEPSDPNIMHSDLCNELRAALTANHSAPVVEE